MERHYLTYEPDIIGTYTECEMRTLYRDQVEKQGYPDYVTWIADMIKSGIFVLQIIMQ